MIKESKEGLSEFKFFSHDFPPNSSPYIYDGEIISGGKIFHKVTDIISKKMKFFETEEAAEIFAKEKNMPFLKSYKEWCDWVTKNPRPIKKMSDRYLPW